MLLSGAFLLFVVWQRLLFLASWVAFILFFIFIYVVRLYAIIVPRFLSTLRGCGKPTSMFYRTHCLLVFAKALFEIRHPKQEPICVGAGFLFWFPFHFFCYCFVCIFVSRFVALAVL